MTATSKISIGIVGCGNISTQYLDVLPHFKHLEVAACADLDLARAKARANAYNIRKACSVKDLLADPEIQIILNLTIPKAHGEVAAAALEANKSVYNEKPLALTREEGQKLLNLAQAKKLLIGGAPDTFLGAGLQTCRKLIDDGAIGVPIASTAFFACHGPESWHPDPDFYYQPGAGPMFDMGPYYLTALIMLLGPVRRVTGSAKITFPERQITSQPKSGTMIKVNTPTHIAGIMDFHNGALGTILTSFDVWATELPRIEIYGTNGSLSVPDPNYFGHAVRIRGASDTEWKEVPHTHNHAEQSRGIGVADMASALISGRPHRANGELTYHVLDLMHAFHEASSQGQHIEMTSTCTRPAALPAGLAPFILDP